MGTDHNALEDLRREIAALPRARMSVADVFRESMRRIGARVSCDGWCGLTLDPATLLMTGGVHEHGLIPEAIRRLLEIEHGGEDVDLLADLARRPAPVGILSESAGERLEASARYREVLRPSGYEHEMRLIARSGSRVWGALILLRKPSVADFDVRDRRVLEAVSEPLAEAIRAALLVAAAVAPPDPADRALVVLDRANSVESSTPAALRWLEDLAEFGPPDTARVPHTVQVIANETRRLAAAGGVARALCQSRVRSRSGAWLVLQGTLLGEGSDRVAVFIEPARPLEVASLILDAYGLTRREGELVHCVLQGFDTGQIAELLGISTYTVQDHLKSVFDKVGVWSRKELVSRLFFKHYLPRMQQGLPLGPDGWFVERGRHEA